MVLRATRIGHLGPCSSIGRVEGYLNSLLVKPYARIGAIDLNHLVAAGELG